MNGWKDRGMKKRKDRCSAGQNREIIINSNIKQLDLEYFCHLMWSICFPARYHSLANPDVSIDAPHRGCPLVYQWRRTISLWDIKQLLGCLHANVMMFTVLCKPPVLIESFKRCLAHCSNLARWDIVDNARVEVMNCKHWTSIRIKPVGVRHQNKLLLKIINFLLQWEIHVY